MKTKEVMTITRKRPETPDEFIRRYPRLTAHIVAESLGYATPTKAAWIGLDGRDGRPNYCEWVDAVYKGNARRCLQAAIRNRHFHKGYMGDYRLAKKIVDHYLETGEEPLFASWF